MTDLYIYPQVACLALVDLPPCVDALDAELRLSQVAVPSACRGAELAALCRQALGGAAAPEPGNTQRISLRPGRGLERAE